MRGRSVDFDFDFDFGRVGFLVAALCALAMAPGAAVAQGEQTAQRDQMAQRDQRPRSAVLGDTIRVGDVVPVAVRVVVERGARVAWPDTLPLSGDPLENAARVRERVDTLPDGRLQVTGVYSVTPWRAGEHPLPDLSLQLVTGREGVRSLTAAFPPLEVLSVLPTDTAGLEPRPARGVMGPSWALWPFVLGLILLLAVIAALVWWWRRRAAAAAAIPAAPPVPPRERVLARLQEARDAGLVERGEMKEFYSRITEALRDYLAVIGAAWGADLTTTELLSRFRAQVGPEEARDLDRLLRPADQVKFARRQPDAATAIAEWDAARSWVVDFQWPPGRAPEERGEAA